MSAKAIFEQVVVAGWDGVLGWKSKRQEESLHLEFKNRSRQAALQLDEGDKSHISKALSGFANVDGGILVMGVVTKKQDDAPDVVTEIASIEKVDEFANQVDRNLPNLTNPPISGLRSEVIKEPGQERGVVAIYVPTSDGGPHRTAIGDSKTIERYYMRTGTNTVIMPHPLLAAMCGRRPQPRLRLTVKVVLEAGHRPLLLCWLRNEGRGPAREARVLMKLGGNVIHFTDMQTMQGATGAKVARLWMGEGTIYPGEEIELRSGRCEHADAVSLRGTIYALDAEPVAFEQELDLRAHNKMVSIPED